VFLLLILLIGVSLNSGDAKIPKYDVPSILYKGTHESYVPTQN
jgi:hypothetical protein